MNLLVHYFSISVLPVCLPPLYYFSFFFVFSNLHFWWQYHSQLICVMPLNTCNYAQTLWVCFGAVIALIFSLFLPFCLDALYLFSTFFSNFALSMTALLLIRTVLQSAHLSDATEYLQICTILMSFFRSCKRTSTFLFFYLFDHWNFFFYFSWSACSAGELKICIEQPRCLKHTAWHFILQVSYKLFSFW